MTNYLFELIEPIDSALVDNDYWDLDDEQNLIKARKLYENLGPQIKLLYRIFNEGAVTILNDKHDGYDVDESVVRLIWLVQKYYFITDQENELIKLYSVEIPHLLQKYKFIESFYLDNLCLYLISKMIKGTRRSKLKINSNKETIKDAWTIYNCFTNDGTQKTYIIPECKKDDDLLNLWNWEYNEAINLDYFEKHDKT